MRTLYSESNGSFLDLLRPMFSELNSLYWVVASQSRFLTYDWIGSPREERIIDHWFVPVPAFKGTEMVLMRPGALSELDGNLIFDEWTYFIGFQARDGEAVERGCRLGTSPYFSSEFYDLLTREGFLFAVHVDGWWEFCPATDAVFARIRGCAPFREIAPRSAGQIDWTPHFV
jgi:hypothetical protein